MEQNDQSKETSRRLERLESLSWWMDEAFEIPVLKWRVGFDAIFGLIPWLGDAIGALVSAVIIWEASRIKVSFWVLLRMGLNVVLEFLVGSVPFLGDIFDMHFKSNRKNVELLKGVHRTPGRQEATSRVVVLVFIFGLFAVLIGLSFGIVWLLMQLWNVLMSR